MINKMCITELFLQIVDTLTIQLENCMTKFHIQIDSFPENPIKLATFQPKIMLKFINFSPPVFKQTSTQKTHIKQPKEREINFEIFRFLFLHSRVVCFSFSIQINLILKRTHCAW